MKARARSYANARARSYAMALLAAACACSGPSRAQEPLSVCVADDNPPYAARAKGAGSGFDVRLAEAIAAEMKRPLKLMWHEIEREKETSPTLEVNAMLSAGLCDLAAGYMLYEPALGAPSAASVRTPDHDGAKPKRQRPWVTLERLVASDPYQASVLTIAVRPGLDAGAIRSLGDLSQMRIGSVAGSLAGALLAVYRNGALRGNVVSLGWRDQPLQQLEAGKFDAAVVELSRLDAHRLRQPDTRVGASGYLLPLRFNLGFAALESKRELVDTLNRILRELQARGRLAEIARETGLTLVAPGTPAIQPEITLQNLRDGAGS